MTKIQDFCGNSNEIIQNDHKNVNIALNLVKIAVVNLYKSLYICITKIIRNRKSTKLLWQNY